jgi:hypothetical protein
MITITTEITKVVTGRRCSYADDGSSTNGSMHSSVSFFTLLTLRLTAYASIRLSSYGRNRFRKSSDEVVESICEGESRASSKA